MSVTLAAAIISLLLAAVGFHSHKDSVQWQFAGERKGSNSEEKSTTLSDSVLNSTASFEGCSAATAHDFISLNRVQTIQEGMHAG